MRAAMLLPMPLISPEARYSLMPSAVAGSRLSKESICTCLPKRALFTHRPLMRRDAPACGLPICPTTVTRSTSSLPSGLTRNTV